MFLPKFISLRDLTQEAASESDAEPEITGTWVYSAPIALVMKQCLRFNSGEQPLGISKLWLRWPSWPSAHNEFADCAPPTEVIMRKVCRVFVITALLIGLLGMGPEFHQSHGIGDCRAP